MNQFYPIYSIEKTLTNDCHRFMRFLRFSFNFFYEYYCSGMAQPQLCLTHATPFPSDDLSVLGQPDQGFGFGK